MDIFSSRAKSSSADLLSQSQSIDDISTVEATTSAQASRQETRSVHNKPRSYQTYSICNVIIFVFTVILVLIQLAILLKNSAPISLTVQAMAVLGPSMLIVTIVSLVMSIKSRQAYKKGQEESALKFANHSLAMNLISDLALCMCIIYVKALDY